VVLVRTWTEASSTTWQEWYRPSWCTTHGSAPASTISTDGSSGAGGQGVRGWDADVEIGPRPRDLCTTIR
jgi:hypothetical protein